MRFSSTGMQVVRWLAAVLVVAWSSFVLVPQANAAANYNPGPVTGVGATPQNGALIIYWQPPAFSGVDSRGGSIPIVKYDVKLVSASGTAGTCTTVSPGCTVSGLKNGTQYSVEIRAFNSYSYASWTGGGPFSPCCSVPSAPTSVVAKAGDGTASVSWGPPANAAEAIGPFSYAVTSTVPGVACTTTGGNCSFTGIANGTNVTFYVTASTASGTSAQGRSNTVVPMGLPGAPTDVRAFLDKGAAEVSWTGPANTGGGVIGRYVAVSSPGGLTCESDGAPACRVRGLSNGTTYTFTVTAYNVVGAGPVSEASAPARLLAGPGAPKSVTAKAVRGSATIAWKPPASSGGLRIQKYTVTSSPGHKTCTTKKTSCVIGGLSDGTKYVFVVVAHNAKGAGLPAASRAVWTPAAPAPPAPAPAPAPEPEKPVQPLS